MELDNRKQKILKAIIEEYTRTGEPVGSKRIASLLDIVASPATIRNDMAILFDMGLLEQPHTSAGRVPTNKAYRYYVENLDRTKQISPADQKNIKEHFDILDGDSQKFLAGAAKLFSDILGYTVIIAPPTDPDMQFVNFTAVKTGRYSIVLVATTGRGEVHTRVVRLSEEIGTTQLNQLVSLINSRLCFICYDDVDRAYFTHLIENLEKENKAFGQFLQGALALMSR